VFVGEGSGVSEAAAVTVTASVGVTEAVSVELGSVAVSVVRGGVFAAVLVTTGTGLGVAVQAPRISRAVRMSVPLIDSF
jgi:hypothetical protein